MIIEQDNATGNRDFSIYNQRFLDFVQNNPGAIEAANFTTDFYYEKEHVLQPWPTFVSPETVAQFSHASESLFRLIKSIPQRLFDNDPGKIASYFHLPRSLVEIQMTGVTGEHLRNLMARADFAWTPTGLKCFEYNISANIGGFSVPMWIEGYMKSPLLKKFLAEQDIVIRNTHLVKQLLEHIVSNTAGQTSQDGEEVNLVMATSAGEFQGTVGEDFARLYKDLLAAHQPPLKGAAWIVGLKDREFKQNRLFYRGNPVHAMIETQHGVVSPAVLTAFKAGNLKLYNGPITPLLSNKFTLALLSDYDRIDAEAFSHEEKKLIDAHIPWSRKLQPGNTTFYGDTLELEQIIIQEKDRFVIKPSIGIAGIDVHIGKNTSAAQWEQLVTKAMQQKKWLVQEYIETVPALYQAGEKGVLPHHIGLGIFLLGENYAGAWARVLPVKDNKGIINVKQGARVSIVLEVDK